MKYLQSEVTILALILVHLCQVKYTCGLSFCSLPTKLRMDQVTQSYPETFFRTLFSSVPRRQFAIQNVTLEVEAEFLQIIGASSSGKSTILRLVLGQDESPISGTVSWSPPAIRPVSLEQGKSSYAYERSQTTKTILMNARSKGCDVIYWETVVIYLCELVGFGARALESTPSNLSPSELYRFELIRASLESLQPALNPIKEDTLPSPLLMLDEWMDLETSSTVGRVEESLLNLTRQGAVILCVTHKPHLFSKLHRSITMCRGEILSETPIQQ